MLYQADWHIRGNEESSECNSGRLSSHELIQLAGDLKHEDEVIYTYHPNYINLGARIAIWGLDGARVLIDVQFTAHCWVASIDINKLPEFFENYADYIQNPEKYDLDRAE